MMFLKDGSDIHANSLTRLSPVDLSKLFCRTYGVISFPFGYLIISDVKSQPRVPNCVGY